MIDNEDQNAAIPPERAPPSSAASRPDRPVAAPMPTWAKVMLIIVVGIPLGLVALVGLVLGACLLGAR